MKTNAKGESVFLTYILGLLLAGGLYTALLLPIRPFDTKWPGAQVLYPLSDLTLQAQEYMGWVLLGTVLVCVLGCLLCPSAERFRQKGDTLRESGMRLFYLIFRTMRGIGMVVAFPLTLIALVYALVARK